MCRLDNRLALKQSPHSMAPTIPDAAKQLAISLQLEARTA